MSQPVRKEPTENLSPAIRAKLSELKRRAKIEFNKGYSVNAWCKIAHKFAEEADFAFLSENYEEAYTKYLISLSITINYLLDQPGFQAGLEEKNRFYVGLLDARKKMLKNAEDSRAKIIELESIKLKEAISHLKTLPIYPTHQMSIAPTLQMPIMPTHQMPMPSNHQNPIVPIRPVLPPLPPKPKVPLPYVPISNGANKKPEARLLPQEQDSIGVKELIPLLNNSNLYAKSKFLILDVRPSHLYQLERMNVSHQVNIDPNFLKQNVSSMQIETKLNLMDPQGYKLFTHRHHYDCIFLLDQSSTHIAVPNLYSQSNFLEHCLYHLYRALTEFDFGALLKHRPVVVVGGLDAWKKKTGTPGIISTPNGESISGVDMPQNHLKRYALPPKPVFRSVQDYFQNVQMNPSKIKQSMQLPPQHQPQAMEMTSSTSSISSVFDNPYYGFTPTKAQLNTLKTQLNAQQPSSSPPPSNLFQPKPQIPSKDKLSYHPPKPPSQPMVTSLSYAMNIGKTGLRNLGNSCYMNSILQCINGTIPFARYFLDGSFKRHINLTNPLGYKGKLASAFEELVRSMWTESVAYISPTKFKGIVGQLADQFKGSDQMDSQEFLAFLLDGLHEDLNLADITQKIKPLDDDIMDRVSEQEASNLAWNHYLLRNNSIIVSLFQGQLRSELRCGTCSKTSVTYNAFMYLTLPIPSNNIKPIDLNQCLDKFVEIETLDGHNQWHCPRCKVPRDSTKRLSISKLPDVLLIHLKRFKFEGPFNSKLDGMVHFPLRGLDLNSYVPKYAPKSSVLSPKGVPLGNTYDLYAVSNHYGNLSGGHYTASLRNGYGGKWCQFDDSRVSDLKEKEVQVVF